MDQLIASLPSFPSIQRLQYVSFVLQTKNAANEGVCETLMLDALAPETQQNNRSYVCELSGPTFDLVCNFSMVGGYTKDLRKSLNCQNWGVSTSRGWVLAKLTFCRTVTD